MTATESKVLTAISDKKPLLQAKGLQSCVDAKGKDQCADALAILIGR